MMVAIKIVLEVGVRILGADVALGLMDRGAEVTLVEVELLEREISLETLPNIIGLTANSFFAIL